MGKPSINGPFSMAMLNNQRVMFSIATSEFTRGYCRRGAAKVMRWHLQLLRPGLPMNHRQILGLVAKIMHGEWDIDLGQLQYFTNLN